MKSLLNKVKQELTCRQESFEISLVQYLQCFTVDLEQRIQRDFIALCA